MEKELYYGRRIFSFNKFKEAMLERCKIKYFEAYDDSFLYALFTLSYKIADGIDLYEKKTIKFKNNLAIDVSLSIIDFEYFRDMFEYGSSGDVDPMHFYYEYDEYADMIHDILNNIIYEYMDANEKFHLIDKISELLRRFRFASSYNEAPASKGETEIILDKSSRLRLFISRLWNKLSSKFLHDRILSEA